MAIILQSSVGGFSAEFMRKLPQLERIMVARGLDPADFIISKDRASPSSLYVIGAFFFEYTVYVGDESFTVTEPNDMVFLDFFFHRCVAEAGRGRRQADPVATARPDHPLLPLDVATDLNACIISLAHLIRHGGA